MYRQGLPSSYGPQSTSGVYPLKAIKTLPGSLGHISRQPQTASSTNSSSNDEDEDDESIEDVTPKVKINPCRSVEISMVHEFPNTEEDVFYIQLPLPDGIEWKIRIFPSGSTSISSFGYFLQPVGHGFNVRLESGGPPIDSWEPNITHVWGVTAPD
ncbi:hypothetical protein EV368DRAFT_68812 [Lentinula lateritia]|nr:hypothetical protein EV368DRAFT_68812 [Lentinula lateritia]